jgi:NADPH-dependent 2,4-dienoyl-CoA reductase/sulfur reductase-like enzyme
VKKEDEMKEFEVVIAGGGLAAARAAKSYRDADGSGRVVLVGEEPTLPYHRPALSKRYLRGETSETPHVEAMAFYRDHDIDVLLETAVTAVDARAHVARLSDGTQLRYAKLLVATGATPLRLRVPGADLDGVFALRTVADSTSIRSAAAGARKAVVVGGGFIGMEVAASLRQLGLEVALVHMGVGLFDQLRSDAVSEQLLVLYRDHDVDVLLEEEVARFGGDGRVECIEAKSGVRVESDLVVVGVGVVPNVGFLDGSGLMVDNGVVVNERFETSAPDVYAVGDVANVFDPLYGRRRRIEHWSNANFQGNEVGKILAGRAGGYDTVSSFFSEVFGTTIKVFGDTSRYDDRREEGTLADGFLASYHHNGRLVGAITIGQSGELEALVKAVISDRASAEALQRQIPGRSR